MLENHMETKHTKKTFRWQESDKKEYNCDMCERKFNNIFVMRYHKCVQETKYACQLCDFMGITLYELYIHLKETHTKENQKCHMCKFESNTKESIDSHIQTEHKAPSVHISAEEQLVFTCDECGYRCGLNIRLRKHKQKYHIQKQDSNEASPKQKYQCDVCDFSSNYLVHTLKHRLSKHPELVTEVLPTNSEDMVPTLIVEQNIENREEIERLKRNVKDSFTEFAENMRPLEKTSRRLQL